MWLVFKKELLELLRDRKTLFFMVALPIVVFPLLFGGVTYFMSQAVSEAQTKTLNYAIIGQDYGLELVDKLAGVESLSLQSLETQPIDDEQKKTLVRDGEVDFIVEIPSNFGSDIINTGQITIKVFLNDAQFNSVQSRLSDVIDELEATYQRVAFASLGLNEDQQTGLLNPMVIEKVNVADERESIGAQVGGLIPYFLFLLCLQGAMLPAADIGAGEKERGTLETLLLSPISRQNIVLGKFLTIAFAGVISALVTVLSMAIWGIVLSQGMAIKVVSDFMASIGLLDFLLVFLMLVPIVAMFAAILLALSIYARSYKEAQGYMTPLVFLVIVPVLVAVIPGIELKGVWAWVPLTNVALAIKELIKGTMDYVQLFAIFGSSVIIAGALIAFCVHWFNKEKVLFR
ncbi:ABC transporter permease [Glaciecola sp. XM2]|jgi:sodium transport system permease protein|uniref:ABC transporter permease n=1 Tax=Glaciecola sp. XM2 TaxID=1914931 RepID=UPI001BDDD93E|nr:ABC transporter permease [Glaciecola sp. XM2]MBT1450945.1 ABC transporter permease [Glaciecola sp. XM2]